MPFRASALPHLPTPCTDTIYRVRRLRMVNRTQWIVSLLFATLLLCVVSVRGQELTRVYILSYPDIDIQYFDYHGEFRTRVDALLQDDGYYLIELPAYGWDERAKLQIDVISEYGVADGFSVSVFATTMSEEMREISELLYSSSIYSDFYSRYTSGDQIRNEDVEITVGLILYSIDRCDLAESHLLEARDLSLNQEPIPLRAFSQASFYLGNCELLAGDFEVAQSYFEHILQVVPPNFNVDLLEPTVNLAWIYIQHGNQEMAFQLLQDLVDAQDENRLIRVLIDRSQLYALAFHFDEAIADMDAAIQLAPDNPSLYIQRGQHLLLLYEWDRALADYNYALELDPDYANAYYYRGIVYASAPEGIDARAAAIAAFQHYLELSPNGTHAEDAQRYLTQIQSQLDSLDISPSTRGN